MIHQHRIKEAAHGKSDGESTCEVPFQRARQPLGLLPYHQKQERWHQQAQNAELNGEIQVFIMRVNGCLYAQTIDLLCVGSGEAAGADADNGMR